MNEGINVRRDDILWRFYCKRFVVEGKEIEAPKNLCRYFWTSVKGFGLWLGREVMLRSLWLISIVATAILFGMARAIPNANNIVATVVVGTIVFLWSFAFLMAMFVTLYRVKRVVEARAPWVIYFLGACFILVAIVRAITQGTLWPEFTRLFGDVLQWGRYILVVMIVMLVITLTLRMVPHRRLQKLRGLFETLGAFMSAKKNRVCPPINPPKDLDVRP